MGEAIGAPPAEARFRLGTQSWTYFPDWLGVFYPPYLAPAAALAFYAGVFDTVEVNATFHAIPSDATLRGWYRKTPDNFSFALKFPRAISHDALLDLDSCGLLVADFFHAAALLGEKLGPLLLQLPPSFDRSPGHRRALARFLDYLPAADVRIALELRHPSWITPSVETALRDRGVAWCLTDGGRTEKTALYTAEFTYVRWNRAGLEFPDFSRVWHPRLQDLSWWAETLAAVPPSVRTIYCYMSNEFEGHAPTSLRSLQHLLHLPAWSSEKQGALPLR